MSDPLLALDIGSSSVRAAVFDSDGRHGPVASRAYADRTQRASSGVFPAPEVASLVRDLLLELELASVKTVAISSLWHSIVGVDRDGTPVTDVYTWESSAPAVTLPSLRTALDQSSYRERTGSYLHSSYPLAGWWYLRSRSGPAHRWIDLPSWVASEVLGVEGGWSVDMAAGSGLWNQDSGSWDDTTLSIVGLPVADLGPLWTAPQPVGEQAHTFGLAGAVVVPPYGDGACSSIGVGAVGGAVSALTAGTSGSLRTLLNGPPPTVPFGLWRYQLGDITAIGGAASNVGNLLQWTRSTLGVDDPLAFAEGAPPRFDGLLATPDFAGQRGPFYAADAAGGIGGLRLHHTRQDIAHALAFAILGTYRELAALTIQAVPTVTSFIAAGGVLNARPVFAQLLADATNRPVYVANADEASLVGAALRTRGQSAPLPETEPLVPRSEWVEAISEREAASTPTTQGGVTV